MNGINKCNFRLSQASIKEVGEINKDRFSLTFTSSGQRLEQRPLSTKRETEMSESDMLLSMCYVSGAITRCCGRNCAGVAPAARGPLHQHVSNVKQRNKLLLYTMP